ncbi:MAG TPA: uracil-DNA glycosylase [Polyangiaceae bacterium]|nr:uracil-DNA glycosylase [Polyangiaceae bacterium]
MSDDPRSELAGLAASLRAYLECHQDAGTVGFPRRTEKPLARAVSPAPTPALTPAPTPALTPAPAPALTPTPASPSPLPVDRHLRLPQLAAEVAACTKCALATTRTQTVFSRGNPDAQLCFIGEAPGADEDARGLPFVGRAGQLLDRMVVAMGLSPETDVYVCNILKCRPPGNRRPEPEEMAACFPYLHEQLALVRPRVIVALGNTAVGALLDTKLGITKVRGQWKLYRGQTLVMPTYHPSYLLRPSPQQVEAKRQTWEDLQLVMKELGLELPRKKG